MLPNEVNVFFCVLLIQRKEDVLLHVPTHLKVQSWQTSTGCIKRVILIVLIEVCATECDIRCDVLWV